VDRVIGLHEAYRFARRYAPAVIFVEDIDRVTEGGRSVKVDDILNNCDGIESKSLEVITIFTTNHVENIQKAMIRPGRIDVVLHIGAPDAVAAARLIREYSKDILAPGEDITEASQIMAGNIPAMIREIVERAKLYCINRSTDTTEVLLTNRDLVEATKLMQGHMDLLKPSTDAIISVEEQVGKHLFKLMDKNLKPAEAELTELSKKMEEIKQRLG
jgi:transitional endoplasmic reticulum ATPase